MPEFVAAKAGIANEFATLFVTVADADVVLSTDPQALATDRKTIPFNPHAAPVAFPAPTLMYPLASAFNRSCSDPNPVAVFIENGPFVLYRYAAPLNAAMPIPVPAPPFTALLKLKLPITAAI